MKRLERQFHFTDTEFDVFCSFQLKYAFRSVFLRLALAHTHIYHRCDKLTEPCQDTKDILVLSAIKLINTDVPYVDRYIFLIDVILLFSVCDNI